MSEYDIATNSQPYHEDLAGPAVDELIVQFNLARMEEDRRLRSRERVRISPWNPRATMRWDQERCKKRLQNLTAWTDSWWRRRGYKVVWSNDAVGYLLPSFTVEALSQEAE